MTKKLYIDFETYSEADIRSVGAWAYSKHPSTEVLMLGWAVEADAPAIWTPGEPLPYWAENLLNLNGGFQFHAWNDFFELAIMLNVLSWPVPPPRYWSDTAAKAAALALPRTLGDCGAALGLPQDQAKDKAGKGLISLFSKPKVSMKKATRGQLVRTLPADAPADFERFKEYCKHDVIAERAIDRLLPDLQPRTRKTWELDRAINLRGVKFDMQAVGNARVVIEKAKAAGNKKVNEISGGALPNINSRSQFLTYCEDLGVKLENAQKEYLKRQVAELDSRQLRTAGENKALDLIKLRLYVSKSSLAKYDKLAAIIDESSRGYGLLRFHGASTGRWSGNLFQPQNLPRKSIDDPDLCIDLLSFRDPDIIEIFFDDALDVVSCCLRGMITASPGNRLIVSDFSQIESRVLAWLAGDIDKLQYYRDGKDIYKVNAAAAFKVPYSEVTKEQRQIGKVIELACGYQGAVGAFQQFAQVYGVVIPDNDAKKLIGNWRTGNPKITSYWTAVEAAAVRAVAEPGSAQRVRGVNFKVQGSGHTQFLFCYLPSGRRIAYHRPRLIESKFDSYQIEYLGINSLTRKYCRTKTYGGKLCENITQAVAADCMIDAMLRVEAAGYPIVLTVHDEIVSDTPAGRGSLDDFNKLMEITPGWADGLPIDADGYESRRYKK